MKANKIMLMMLSLCVLCFSGCKSEDEEAHHFDNLFYVSSAGLVDDMLIQAGLSEDSRTITARLALPAEEDIRVTFGADQSMAAYYNMVYYDNAVALPEGYYEFEETVVEIARGRVEGNDITINFIGIDQLDDDYRYVLPVTVKNINGIKVLDSKKTVFFVFKGAALINVVCNLSQNRAYPSFDPADNPVKNMYTFTLETLIYAESFPNTLNTLMGIEDLFLLRCGDSGVSANQLQIASSSKITSTDLQFNTNTWYHIAVTFSSGTVNVYINGELKCTGSAGRSYVNFGVRHTNEEDGTRCFWIGYSYSSDRYFDGRFSEVRIWNKALTEEEINTTNHFYYVDPDSEGLVAYWKFNEGEGTVVYDQTAYGNDLTIESEPTWVAVELPEK